MSLIQVKFSFPDMLGAFRSAEQEVMLFVAAQLQTNRGLMFDDGNAGRPTPWAPLKYRIGQPLSLTGTLRRSWQGDMQGHPGADGVVRASGYEVTIGTNVAYALIHNTGGVIRPKNKPMLWIPLPDGAKNSANAPSKLTKDMVKNAAKGDYLKRLEKQIEKAKARYTKIGGRINEDKLVNLRMKKHNLEKGHTGGPPIVHYKGKTFMLAKQVTIPKRPMDEWTEADQQELSMALANKIAEVLKRA